MPGRLLKQFITFAEELHFGRAAARLNMSQPPLSQVIKHLEEIVGVKLLARSKHFVALEPAGMAFLAEARELLAQQQRAIDTARRASVGRTGKVTFGSVSYELLPRMLRAFREQFPAIHVDLRELTSTEQIAHLLARKIDPGIVRLPLANAADIVLRPIEAERSSPCCPRATTLGTPPACAWNNWPISAAKPARIAATGTGVNFVGALRNIASTFLRCSLLMTIFQRTVRVRVRGCHCVRG